MKRSFSLSSFGSGSRGSAYPTKETINLVDIDSTGARWVTQIALFLVLLALVGIFTKFAVIDPLAVGMKSSADLVQAETELAQLKADNADYAEVNKQYARYVVTGLTDEERSLTDRDTMLDLLETTVMNVGYPASLKVVGNTATVTLLGVDLDQVSQLVVLLREDSRVAYVTVSTAQGETDVSTSATIVITFRDALDTTAQDPQDTTARADTSGEGR